MDAEIAPPRDAASTSVAIVSLYIVIICIGLEAILFCVMVKSIYGILE
jgi:hypothetical protein